MELYFQPVILLKLNLDQASENSAKSSTSTIARMKSLDIDLGD